MANAKISMRNRHSHAVFVFNDVGVKAPDFDAYEWDLYLSL